MQLPRPNLGNSTFLYVFYTAVLFLVFVVVTFPYDVIIRNFTAANDSPVVVDFDDARFAWHRGIALDGFRMHPVHGDPRVPTLQAETLWARPSLTALFSRQYGLQAQADLYGGSGELGVQLVEQSLVGDMTLSGLSLGRYRPVAGMLDEGRIGGRVDAQLTFNLPLAAPDSGVADGVVRLSRAALQEAKIAGFGVPNVNLDQSHLDFAFKNGAVEVKELKADGKEINLDVAGQVALREPVENSVLNLRATIKPGPEAPDDIRGLLSLVPRPAGGNEDSPVRITGTFARPRVR